jgi:hypothetical protein
MWSPLKSSQGLSLRCLATETAKGAADTASVRAAEAQRRTSEAGEFGAALTPRPRGGRLVRPGKLFRRRGWRRRLRDLALGETCRDGLAYTTKGTDHLAHSPNFPHKPRQTARSVLCDLAPRALVTRLDAAPISKPTNRDAPAVSPQSTGMMVAFKHATPGARCRTRRADAGGGRGRRRREALIRGRGNGFFRLRTRPRRAEPFLRANLCGGAAGRMGPPDDLWHLGERA